MQGAALVCLLLGPLQVWSHAVEDHARQRLMRAESHVAAATNSGGTIKVIKDHHQSPNELPERSKLRRVATPMEKRGGIVPNKIVPDDSGLEPVNPDDIILTPFSAVEIIKLKSRTRQAEGRLQELQHEQHKIGVQRKVKESLLDAKTQKLRTIFQKINASKAVPKTAAKAALGQNQIFANANSTNDPVPWLAATQLDAEGACHHALQVTIDMLAHSNNMYDDESKQFVQELDNLNPDVLKRAQHIINHFGPKEAINAHEILTIADLNHLVECEDHMKKVRLEEHDTMPDGTLLAQGDMGACTVQPGDNPLDGESSSSYVELQAAAAQGLRYAGGTWFDGQISYCFAPNISAITKDAFKISVKRLSDIVPCVNFTEIESVGQPEGPQCVSVPSIVVQDHMPGCWSFVGQVSGRPGCEPKDFIQKSQPLNLGEGCAFVGEIQHQLGHALGMTHETARGDRDRYIYWHKENMPPGSFDTLFPKGSSDFNETAYDVLSLMHFGAFDFSTNGLITIEPNETMLTHFIGQRTGYSQLDIEHIGELYGCLHSVKPNFINVDLKDSVEKGITDPCEDETPSGLANSNTQQDFSCEDLQKYCDNPRVGPLVRQSCKRACYVCRKKPVEHKHTHGNHGHGILDHNKGPGGEPLVPGPNGELGYYSKNGDFQKNSNGGTSYRKNVQSGPVCLDDLDHGRASTADLECPKLQQYCQTHQDVKTKCAKTCNACPTCEDSIEPGFKLQHSPQSPVVMATCTMLKSSCSNGKYGVDVQNKCPVTCGVCTMNAGVGGACEDAEHTRFTIDDLPAQCFQLKDRCSDTEYGASIRQTCPKTCGSPCEGVHTGKHLHACQDGLDSGFKLYGKVAPCGDLTTFCHHAKYGTQIRAGCPKTCQVCNSKMPLGMLEGCADSENGTGIRLFGREATCEDLFVFCDNPDQVTSQFADLLQIIRTHCPMTCNTCSAVDPEMQEFHSGGHIYSGDKGKGGSCKDKTIIPNAIHGHAMTCQQVANFQFCDHHIEGDNSHRKLKESCPVACNACGDLTGDHSNLCYNHADSGFHFAMGQNAAHCDDLKAYCAHPKWGKQVRQKCCRMCSGCEDTIEPTGLQLLGHDAVCAELEVNCHNNSTHSDMINERCPHTCRTCWNRRRRRANQVHYFNW